MFQLATSCTQDTGRRQTKQTTHNTENRRSVLLVSTLISPHENITSLNLPT